MDKECFTKDISEYNHKTKKTSKDNKTKSYAMVMAENIFF